MKNEYYVSIPDFDTLQSLAVSDPEAFSLLKESLVQVVMDNASDHGKLNLERLQFRIDREIACAKNPYDAMVRVSGLMHEKLNFLSHSFEMLCAPSNEQVIDRFFEHGSEKLTFVDFNTGERLEAVEN